MALAGEKSGAALRLSPQSKTVLSAAAGRPPEVKYAPLACWQDICIAMSSIVSDNHRSGGLAWLQWVIGVAVQGDLLC